MCVLTQKKTDKIRYGYKVVAISNRSSKRWSLAMGFCYDDHEKIPIVAEQNGISNYFYQRILVETEHCYEPNMIGRTALYENLSDAMHLYTSIKNHFEPSTELHITSIYRLAIMRCSVEEDIMSGRYGNQRVIAGRKLTFLSEPPIG